MRLLLAAVAGLLGAAAFPKPGIWPLAFVSVAGLSIAVAGQRSRRGALLGLVYGAGLFLPMLHWTATYVGAVPWLILVFSQTWYLILLGAALPVVQRRRFGAVLSATLWVAEEALRDRVPFGGFPSVSRSGCAVTSTSQRSARTLAIVAAKLFARGSKRKLSCETGVRLSP